MTRTALAVALGLLLVPATGSARMDAAPGLVAAYGFDEGSGTIAADASGNGHTGVASGTTWTIGRFGGALAFDGTSSHVLLGSLGTFYQGGFTLEAWVQKQTATRNDVAVVGTHTGGGGPMVWVDHLATRYHLTLGNSLPSYLDAGVGPRASVWQHLAATYDGSTARFFVDGTEVASRAVTGSVGASDVWRVGAYGAAPGGFFDGVIDEVRIYDRALTDEEIQTDMDAPVGELDTSGPTQPGAFAVSESTASSITTTWAASTDDVGVLGYTVFVNGTQVATTGATTFSFGGLSCGVGYQLGVEAFDGSGNRSSRALLTASHPCGAGGGLVAAYAFDEGGGEVAADASGNGHAGAIAGGAGWTTGRHGGGLALDGTDDSVLLGSLGTFYTEGFTLEAWVRKDSATRNDVSVVGSWSPGGGPMIWVDHLATRYRLTFGTSLSSYLDSGRSPAAGEWQHLAGTFDGTTARFYVDGVEVASMPASGAGASDVWRIGAYGSSPTGFFDGVVDDVRIFDHARTAAQVATDMSSPVTIPSVPADTTPPTAPGSLTATVLPSRATLAWAAATDDVGVTAFNVHRSTNPGFTPTAENRIARPTAAGYVDDGLASDLYYYKVTAEDAAGNVSPPSPEAAADVPPPDTVAPTVSITSPAPGTVSGVQTVAATADDLWGVASVRFEVDGFLLFEDEVAPYTATWDTRGELNGIHALTAVARDTAGNVSTSPAIQADATNDGGASAGLRASYAFDEAAGTSAADSSGNTKTATLEGASRAPGRFGTAASFDGTAARVDLPAFGVFYSAGFTLEGWVNKTSTKSDVAVLGTWTGGQGGGPMIWVDHATGRYRLTLGNVFDRYLDSGRAPTPGRWQHLAATYDGSVARFYVDGVETASRDVTWNLGNANLWRVGAYGSPVNGFFDGLIDNVRIYDRALSAAEVATNRASRVQLEREAPTVVSRVPGPGATDVGITDPITVRFDEPMQATSITTSTFTLRIPGGAAVPAAVSFDAATNVARLTPVGALDFATTYQLRLESPAITDLSGNPIAADLAWTFTTQAAPPPVLVVASTANPFGLYLGEILRNEGVSSFTTIDVAFVTPALLSRFDVVLLGEMQLSAVQVSTFSNWVSAGGNLVAMRPDPQLAGLLGLTDAGGTLSEAYLDVDSTRDAGLGIVSTPIQFHGTADRYTLNGATPLAMLYSDAATPTGHPAVTTRSVGSSGGQAAAFTYDLARSVVYTRQGNPAWAGQERDGVVGLRPGDMFYGAAAGDPQPDWLDTTRIAIPQADEQQRLLVNMVTRMVRDQLPLPRFWYLPRGEKAVLVLSGDDHSPVSSEGYTGEIFEYFKSVSPSGCNVAAWECVRATSYMYHEATLTPAQAAAYVAEGFEVALHPNFGGACPPAPDAAELAALLDTQLSQFAARYPNVPAPRTNRTHCVGWPDWASAPKLEAARGIRLDANYYHYPASWIGDAPGFMTGGGFPMRFADVDGTLIDVYQQHTHLNDEASQPYPETVDALLDNALGPNGFYGAFGTNIHHDFGAPRPMNEEIIQSAQARGVPLISYSQMLDWVDGRASSKIHELSWSAGTLAFTTTVANGAAGLQTLLPTRARGGTTLASLTCDGAPQSYTLETIKGLRYAVFAASDATCRATYS